MITIALDTGNKHIKTENGYFVSGISQSDVIISQKKDYYKLNGKNYILSSQRQSYLRDKTESERYYNLSIMAIVRELEKRLEDGSVEYKKNEIYDIHLLCGLPPAHLKDAKLKRKYQAYFKRDEDIKVLYNDKVWNFRIKKVSLYSQCFAAAMTVYKDIKSYPRVLGVDLGGFTADYLIFKNGKADINAIDSLEKGVIILYQRIIKECLAKDIIIEEDDIDNVLLGKDKLLDNIVLKIVEKETKKFVEEFLGAFREYQIDLKNYLIVFIGGGSILLKKYLESSPLVKNCIFVDDICANAKGYKILYEISQKRK